MWINPDAANLSITPTGKMPSAKDGPFTGVVPRAGDIVRVGMPGNALSPLDFVFKQPDWVGVE